MSEQNLPGVLKEHMIFQKTRTQSLHDVNTLNMWGFELNNVDIIRSLVNVETLSLSLNKIASLSAFSHCYKLKNLYLRQNNISNLGEIDYLVNLPNLRNLMLRDNPIAELPNYRAYVVSKLPQLDKLDDIDVSIRDGPAPSQSRAQAAPAVQHNEQKSSLARATNIRSSQNFTETFGKQNFDFEQKQYQPKPRLVNQQNYINAQPNQQQQRKSLNAMSSMKTPCSYDQNMLTAVLSLLPELSTDSLQIVLDAIQERCM